MDKYSKIILINEVLFSVGALAFFYLGADRNVPIGFIVIVIGVGFFTLIQYFYLKRVLPGLEKNVQGLFFKNLLHFLMVGLCLTISAIIANTIITNNFDYTVVIFNFVLINVPIILYALWFYFFNVLLLRFIK